MSDMLYVFFFLTALSMIKRIRLPMQMQRHGFSPWVRKIPWRRKWQLTPVFLPGKSHGQKSLVESLRSQSWTQLSDYKQHRTVAEVYVS